MHTLSKRHRPGSFSGLITDMLLLSYCSLLRNIEHRPDFYRWCLKKDIYDRRLSWLVLTYLGKDHRTRESFAAHLAFNAIYFIYLRHLTSRVKLHAISRRFSAGFAGFYVLSIASGYCVLAMHIARNLFRQSRQFEVVGALPPNVALAVKLPSHSFVVPDGYVPANARVYPSFGSYLAGRTDKIAVLSLDEYVRHSKGIDGSGDVEASPIAVRRSSARWSARIFFRNLDIVLKGAVRAVFSTRPLFWLETVRSDLLSSPHTDLIRRLETAGTAVVDIYAIPFDDIGALRTRRPYWEKLVAVNYSRNVNIPPARRLDADGLVPLHVYFMTGQAIGFTDVMRQIDAKKDEAAKRFGVVLPVPRKPLAADIPLQLGFEQVAVDLPADGLPAIAVFDVPPHAMDRTLGLWLSGDRTSEDNVNEAFLREVVSQSAAMGFRVLIKPKYALTNYRGRYRALLDDLLARYPDHFSIVKPYTELTSLLRSSVGAISFPYTSTAAIAAAMGIPSAYLFPGTHANSLFRDELSAPVLCGTDELRTFLLQIQSKVIL